MINFIQYLLENRARQIQYKSAYELLEQYKDDPDIYISMTNIDKMGINPQSGYNTPLGIYTYPLKQHWKKFNKNDMVLDLPFHGSSPYIWVLKQNCRKFVDNLYKDYTSLDYDRDMAIIKKEYGNHKVFAVKRAGLKALKAKIDFAAKKVEEYESGTFKDRPLKLYYDNKIREYRDLGYLTGDLEGVTDAEIKKSALDDWVQTQLWNYDDSFKRLSKMYKEQKEPLQGIIDSATSSSRDQNAVSAFWNVTRIIANKLADGNPVDTRYTVIDYNHDRDVNRGNRGALEWNKLLRKLGYCGFADKSGRGIIHPAEPLQAVFLSKKAFKTIEKIDNVPKITKITSVEDMTNAVLRFDIGIQNNKLVYSWSGKGNLAAYYRKIPDNKFKNPKWITEDVVVDLLTSYSRQYFVNYKKRHKKLGVLHGIIEKKLRTMQYSFYMIESLIENLKTLQFNKQFIPYYNYIKKYHKKAEKENVIRHIDYLILAKKYDIKQKNYNIIIKILEKNVNAKVSNRDMAKLDYHGDVWHTLYSYMYNMEKALQIHAIAVDNEKFVLYLNRFKQFRGNTEKNRFKSYIYAAYKLGIKK